MLETDLVVNNQIKIGARQNVANAVKTEQKSYRGETFRDSAQPLQASQDTGRKHALLSDCFPKTERLTAEFFNGVEVPAIQRFTLTMCA
jgi:hypothetical protein